MSPKNYHVAAPELFIPIGFAGGLHDRDTGLVRFGYRDYDTTVGRFTAPDPLGDTGGDHDLYDYCVDDPVTRHDPTGLADADAVGKGGKEHREEYGFIRRNLLPISLPHDHPDKRKAVQMVHDQIREKTNDVATSIIELIAPPLPRYLPTSMGSAVTDTVLGWKVSDALREKGKEFKKRNQQAKTK